MVQLMPLYPQTPSFPHLNPDLFYLSGMGVVTLVVVAAAVFES